MSSFFRDDFRRGEKPLEASETQIDFLVEDKKAGLMPFRSFRGHFYQNGFSDHLPVLLKVQ